MPIVKCELCKNKFYAKPSWLKRGHGKYCSAECQHKSFKKGKVVNCFICKKATYKAPRHIKRSKSKKYFCSKSCQTKWRNTVFIGPKHANWKGGEYAYKSVLSRHKIPKICRLCRTKDTRKLTVHHLDKNHKNNKLKNLVWLCHNCHFLVHHYNEEYNRLMVLVAQW